MALLTLLTTALRTAVGTPDLAGPGARCGAGDPEARSACLLREMGGQCCRPAFR